MFPTSIEVTSLEQLYHCSQCPGSSREEYKLYESTKNFWYMEKKMKQSRTHENILQNEVLYQPFTIHSKSFCIYTVILIYILCGITTVCQCQSMQ